MKSLVLTTSAVATLFFCTSCGYVNSTHVTGGLLGSAAGAGTGAAVGSLISNGDIAASAGLGALIGLPVGIAVAALYEQYQEEQEYKAVQNQIIQNQELLAERQREIDALQQDSFDQSQRLQPNPRRDTYTYGGASVGWGL